MLSVKIGLEAKVCGLEYLTNHTPSFRIHFAFWKNTEHNSGESVDFCIDIPVSENVYICPSFGISI